MVRPTSGKRHRCVGVLIVAWLAGSGAAAASETLMGRPSAPLPMLQPVLVDFHVSIRRPRIIGPLAQVVGHDVVARQEVVREARARRPAVLVPLYASFAGLQALDAHSTARALGRGARERNPLLADVIDTPAAVLGVKVAATVGTIWVAERLWRRGHRRAAVLVMLAVNAAYAAVVAHNYRAGR